MREKFLWSSLILLVVAGLFSVPILAQSPLADIRERINGILVQLRTFDNTCIIILGAQIKEIDVAVLESRKLITANKGNLGRLLLDAVTSAHAHLERAFDTITQCGTLLGRGGAIGDGSIFAEINGVVGDLGKLDDLDPRKEAKINGLIDNTILANLVAIGKRILGETFEPVPAMAGVIARPLTGNGSDGLFGTFSSFSSLVSLYFECLEEFFFTLFLSEKCRSLKSLIDDDDDDDDDDSSPSTVSREVEVVQASQSVASNLSVAPQLTEKGPIPFEFLRLFKRALGIAHQLLVQAQRILRQITQFKKWVYKGLREVHKLLRASNFGGRGAGELLDSISKIYTLNGALVEVQAQGLNTARLSNGVYLVVAESQDTSGKVMALIRKMVVAR